MAEFAIAEFILAHLPAGVLAALVGVAVGVWVKSKFDRRNGHGKERRREAHFGVEWIEGKFDEQGKDIAELKTDVKELSASVNQMIGWKKAKQ